MSMVVAHMDKVKKNNLNGYQKHINRESKNHANKDIDKSRSHLNYDIVANDDYYNNVQESINTRRNAKSVVRSTSVLVNSWIISSDNEFFEDLSEDEQRRYFKESYNYFSERYGKENVSWATVHMDETTPHMHLGITPVTDDGRLSSKELFNRTALREIQDELPLHLQSKGFNIKRGKEDVKAAHKKTDEWKAEREVERANRESYNDAINLQYVELERKRKGLEDKEKELEEKEEELKEKNRKWNQKARDYNARLKRIQKRELNAETRESNLAERERTVNLKEQNGYDEGYVKGKSNGFYGVWDRRTDVINQAIENAERRGKYDEAMRLNGRLNRAKNLTQQNVKDAYDDLEL